MKRLILIILLTCISTGCATTDGGKRQQDSDQITGAGDWEPADGEPFKVQMRNEWRGAELWFCYRQAPMTAIRYPDKWHCRNTKELKSHRQQ